MTLSLSALKKLLNKMKQNTPDRTIKMSTGKHTLLKGENSPEIKNHNKGTKDFLKSIKINHRTKSLIHKLSTLVTYH